MRVRCIQDQPEGEVLFQMGGRFFDGQSSPLELGRDYVVYGIRFRNGGVWYELDTDGGSLTGAPMELFEVVDPRVSRCWRLGRLERSVVLYPQLFFTEYFHDRFSDGEPDLVARFQRLTRDLEAEMAAEPWGWQPDRVVPEEVVPLLVAARPELAERWRPDDETASQPYLAMISLVAELVAAVTASRTEHLDGLFHVAERLLEEGSREVRELVAVGLLEGLQDRSLKASVPLDAWEGWLGPRSRTVWTILAPLWGDEAGAEEVRLRIEEVLGRLERGSVTPAVP